LLAANVPANFSSLSIDGSGYTSIINIGATAATTVINNEVADVVKTDTASEPSQGAPPLAASLEDKIGYLYTMVVRNMKVTDTNTLNQHQVFADNGTTVLWEYDLTNATNITTQAEATTGA